MTFRLGAIVLAVWMPLAVAPTAHAQPARPPQAQKAGQPGKAATAKKPQVAPAEAIALVRGLYPLKPTSEFPFSARLQKFFDAASANSKKIDAPVAGLDFAFQVNAQDTEPGFEKSLKIAPRRSDAKRARVRVSLRNFRPVELLFYLVLENGKWRIDEVRSLREPRWVLSRLYAAGAKEK